MEQNMNEKQIAKETAQELFSFIENSPSCFHVIENMKKELEKAGYEQLLESSNWKVERGGKYYVVRNGSSLIALRIPRQSKPDMELPAGFQIMASHSDAPTFKMKENPEMEAEGHYIKLNVEKYGGMLCAPWFDRPLSVAGRLLVKKDGRLRSVLVNAGRDLVMIPNLAIHMNREANEGIKYNAQKDMLPLYGDETAKGTFFKQIAEAAGVREEEIAGHDLFLYNRMPGSIWGANEEFISSARLDDLQCAFASLKAFLAAGNGASIPVHCVFDNEEVGSGTRQGAASTFLQDTLLRVCDSLGISASVYRRMLASSFMLSADNAHGVHPNYPEKACPTNRPYLNGGVVIKFSANQKYTTDGASAAVFKEICDRAGVPYQVYLNRSDVVGGSTLGNISTTQVALKTVDIGLAQLAMHSPYETAGVRDTQYLIQAAKEFFESAVLEKEDSIVILNEKRLSGCTSGRESRRILLEGLSNTRDLGGIKTEDGRCIVPGRLLRSGAMATATEADKRTLLEEYHLKTVVDFRTELERSEAPDPVWEGVANVFHPITSESAMGITREKGGMADLLDIGEKAEGIMMQLYPHLVCDESARKQYAKFLRMVLNQEDGAILWHCSAGKDRAGMGATLVLFALGVPEDVIRDDYMRTNEYLKADNDRLIQRLADMHQVTPTQIDGVRTIFETRESYFDSAVDAIRKQYGSMDNYFTKGLGLCEEELKALREKYLR